MATALYAQNVGVNTNTPDASAALHVAGTNKGLLIPSIVLTGTADQTTVVGAPYPAGLLIYNSATAGGVTPGFYYWGGSAWARVVTTANIPVNNAWYEVGTTTPPDNIADDIYTSGKVGIGTTTPGAAYTLDVNGNIYSGDNFMLDNSSSTGTIPFRIDGFSNTLYVIAEGGSGQPATSVSLRTATAGSSAIDQVIIQSDGDLEMMNNNIVHMPNNMVYMEDRVEQVKPSGQTWGSVSNTSPTLRVESGNVMVVNVDWKARFDGGDGTDPISYRIYATGTSGCGTIIGATLAYTPPERSNEHDNYMPYTFTDVMPVSCNGNYTFRLEAITTAANDALHVNDVVIVVTIY